jgi:hypothetical protein
MFRDQNSGTNITTSTQRVAVTGSLSTSNDYKMQSATTGADLGATADESSHTHPFTTSSLNGNVTQTATNVTQPTAVHGITLIKT